MNLLTAEQIQHFHEKGWVGPLDTFSLAEVEIVKNCLEKNGNKIVKINGKPSLPLYNNVLNTKTIRDHHLFHQPVADFLKHEKIVRRLNQLGGPDLLLWRSDIFHLIPNPVATQWHQFKEYYWVGDIDYEKPTLKFPENNPNLINFTVWVALTDAPLERGCLKFASGTHQKQFKILRNILPENSGTFANYGAHKSVFYAGKKSSSTFEFDEADWEIAAVPAKAGQIIIFTENVMHAAFPNLTTESRIAINGSYIHPSVQVFPHRVQGDFLDQNGHVIQRHFCMLVSGKDEFGVNVVRDQHDLSAVEAEFQRMGNLVRYGHVELPQNKQQLEIYALEKQAMEGDCQGPEPDPILHPRQYIQWQAWKQCQGMSREAAMQAYSQQVASLPQQSPKPDDQQLATDIQNWLVSYVAELLAISPEQVDLNTHFARYGFDSMAMVNLIADLEDWLGCEIESTIFEEYSTLKALTQHLVSKRNGKPQIAVSYQTAI